MSGKPATVDDLKKWLTTKGLPKGGVKKELILRVRGTEDGHQFSDPPTAGEIYSDLERLSRTGEQGYSGTAGVSSSGASTAGVGRGGKLFKVQESRDKGIRRWTELPAPKISPVLELADANSMVVENYVKENAKIKAKVDGIIQQRRRAVAPTPDGTPRSDESIVFHYLVEDYFLKIQSCTSKKMKEPLTAEELCESIGSLLAVNLSAISNDESFERLPAGKVAFAKFKSIVHALHATDDDFTVEDGNAAAWKAHKERQEVYRASALMFNQKMKQFSRTQVTVDDDVHQIVGKQLQAGEASQLCIIRKGGWVIVFDVVSNIVDGIPTMVMFREGGGGAFDKWLAEYTDNMEGGEMVYLDRGYQSGPNCVKLSNFNLSSLGPIRKNMTSEIPFDHYDLKAYNVKLSVAQNDKLETRKNEGFIPVHSFPGVGNQLKLAKHEDGRIAVCTVVRRGVGTTNDGIITLVGSNSSNEHPVLKAENIHSFVRIPKPMPANYKCLLLSRQPEGDPLAIEVREALHRAKVEIISEVQRDASWGVSRYFTFTASSAEAIIKLVLKLRDDGRYDEVRDMLFESGLDDFGTTSSVVQEEERPVVSYESSNNEYDNDEEADALLCSGETLEDELAASSREARGEEDDDNEEGSGEGQMEAENQHDIVVDSSQPEGHMEVEDQHDPVGESFQPTARELELNGQSMDQDGSAQGQEDSSGFLGVTHQSGAVAQENEDPKEDPQTACIRSIGEQIRKNMMPHSASEAMKTGCLNETEIAKAVKSMDIVSSNKVFETGLIRGTGELSHVGMSPDGLFIVELHLENESIRAPCVAEYKTIMDLKKNARSAIHRPTIVTAGTADYRKYVPKKYRTQLAHGAALLHFHYSLLVLAAKDGLNQTIVIRYSSSQLENYRSLCKDECIVTAYGWFFMTLSSGFTDERIVKEYMPQEFDSCTRSVLATHLRLCRAVGNYRKELKRPIPPTHLFRFGAIHFYDAGKGATDTFCRDICESLKNCTFNFHFRQTITIRFLYFFVISAIKLCRLAKSVRPEDDSSLSLTQFRSRIQREGKSVTTLIMRLADELRQYPFDLATGAALPRVPPSPNASRIPPIIAAYPDEIKTYLEAACKERGVLPKNCIKDGIPYHPQFVAATPGKSSVIDSKYRNPSKYQEAWKEKRELTNNLKTRREFWIGSGKEIRFLRYAVHVDLDLVNKNQCCVWCGNKNTAKRGCMTCGESFCKSGTCFQQFHDYAHFPNPEDLLTPHPKPPMATPQSNGTGSASSQASEVSATQGDTPRTTSKAKARKFDTAPPTLRKKHQRRKSGQQGDTSSDDEDEDS